MNRPRVLIADDHTLLVEAFRNLIAPQFDVVGTVGDGRSLIREAQRLKPDVILVDISMPALNGLDATQQLKQLLPTARIIILTMSDDSELASEALRRGAIGYLLKTSTGTELTQAIRDALRGRIHVTPTVARKMQDTWLRNPRQERRDALTDRQREVLQLLAEGRSMKEAGHVLGVTARTIAFHKYAIMENFGLRSNASLIQLAIREHIVS